MGLLFKISNETYALQLSDIKAITRIDKKLLPIFSKTPVVNFYYSSRPYKVAYMGRLLGITEEISYMNKRSLPLLIIDSVGFEFAVLVDEIIGSREMVIKSLGKQFNQLAICSGATISEDGGVLMLIDTVELAARYKNLLSNKEEKVISIAKRGTLKETVLIVDDSLTVRKVTSSLLERNGYMTKTAANGEEALVAIEQQLPDIMLVDVEMPKMDGFEFSRIIKNQSTTKDIPIIMISSRTGEKYQEQAKNIGINNFLGKPYDRDELLKIMKELLITRKP